MRLPSFFTPAIASLLITAGSPSQVLIYVPNSLPFGRNTNTLPFGGSGITYAGRVRARNLAAASGRLLDVSFVPCCSGSRAFPTLLMGFGHVPTLFPSTFSFPTFDTAGNPVGPGSFLDYTPLWNTTTQGPFVFSFTGSNWSPLGLVTGGGTSFVWNGVNDVAFFVTLSTGAGALVNWLTGDGEPYRAVSNLGYQAPVGNTDGSGLRMALLFGPSTINLPSTTNVGFSCGPPVPPRLLPIGLPSLGNAGFAVQSVFNGPGSATPIPQSLGGGDDLAKCGS